jgi:crossover junction endodeoxyribonuclease RuvC
MTRYVGIDPSTKTGIVVLDEHGDLWEAREIEKLGKDPERMLKLIESVMQQVDPDDVIGIEGFGFASQSGFLLGGIGWGMRMNLWDRGVMYHEIAPAALKKFAGGKGNMKKDELAIEIYKRWGFEHKSDNVRDAYVLAQIARALHEKVKLTVFQQDVLDAIRNPPEKKNKRKAV